ncbi:MAG: preprotein translocase subunit YajC [Pseudomonadota bacterium]
MFITPAYAQTAGGGGGGIVELLFPLILVGLIMWFLVIRPQRQAQKKRDEMLAAIKRNDTVITGGGVVSKVTKVIDDAELEVEIASGVKVRLMRAMIADVRVKGEPVAANDSKPADEGEKPAKKKGSRTRI